MDGNGGSAVTEMEIERLEQEIEKTKKQFYFALLEKKRRVKRTWLEISAMTNAHLLQTLPYRAMLGHVAKITEERDKVIAEITESNNQGNQSSQSEIKEGPDISVTQNALEEHSTSVDENMKLDRCIDESTTNAPQEGDAACKLEERT